MKKQIKVLITTILFSVGSFIYSDSVDENPRDIFLSGLVVRIQKTGGFHTNMVYLSENFPDTQYGIFGSGYINLSKGDLTECIDKFESIIKSKIKIDPYIKRDSYFYKGICNHDLGNYTDAIGDYTKSISLEFGKNPSDTLINNYLERAKTYNSLRKYDLARNNIALAIEKIQISSLYKPYYDLDQLHVDKISLNYSLNEIDAAIKDCNWLIKESKNKKDAGYFYRAQLKYKIKKDLNGGYEDYLKAVEINPKNFAAISSLVEVLNTRKDFSKIPEFLTLAIAIKPKLGVLYYARGFYYHQLNEKNKACEDMKESLNYSSENVVQDSEGYYSIDHLPAAKTYIDSNCK